MELRYRREAMVGAMILAGAVIFTLLMMWLRGRSWSEGEIVHATFNDVAGLKEGDPVRTSGVRVGQVKKIELASPGNVDVWFDVQRGPSPREDATARIISADLFGARFVDYSPGISPRPLATGRTLRGIRAPDMGETAEALGEKGKKLLDSTMSISIAIGHDLRAALASTQRLILTLNSGAEGSSQQLIGALESLRRSLQRVDLLIQQNGPVATEAVSHLRNSSVHADSVMQALERSSVALDSLVWRANHGRGPLPALLNDSTIITQLMQTNTSLRELIEDFKANPGKYIRFRL